MRLPHGPVRRIFAAIRRLVTFLFCWRVIGGHLHIAAGIALFRVMIGHEVGLKKYAANNECHKVCCVALIAAYKILKR